jgi:DNA-binding GntR family transcriptional regulator
MPLTSAGSTGDSAGSSGSSGPHARSRPGQSSGSGAGTRAEAVSVEETGEASSVQLWVNTPVNDRALRHSVTEHVLTALRSGKLSPGERVHETSLARALDVSLSPVRESLFRLADKGWLEHRPRRGFYVRSFSAGETEEIYTFRALLEGFAARQVALRVATGSLAGGALDAARLQLAALIKAGERAARGEGKIAEGAINAEFHDTLVHLAANSLLGRSWEFLAPAEWLLIPTWEPEALAEDVVQDWVARHQRLAELVLSGDPDAAEQEALTHVLTAGRANIQKRFAQTSH